MEWLFLFVVVIVAVIFVLKAKSAVQALVTSTDNTRNCPKCSSGLTQRTVKKSEHAGKKILACSIYPA
jgi:ssDNA-binding Zn-finger/Zn-ribbon topoisomerase 1